MEEISLVFKYKNNKPNGYQTWLKYFMITLMRIIGKRYPKKKEKEKEKNKGLARGFRIRGGLKIWAYLN